MKQLILDVHEELRCDVLVVGGGVAGCAAAVAAARLGADVILAEQWGVLGGSATLTLVSPPSSLNTASGESFGGLCREIYSRTMEEAVAYAGANDQSVCSPHILKSVLLDKVTQAGVRLLLHSKLISAETEAGRIVRAAFATASGIDAVRAKAYIDASGDAALTRLAGGKSVFGCEPDAYRQLSELHMNRVHTEETLQKVQEGDIPKELEYKHTACGGVQPVSSMFVLGGVDSDAGAALINRQLSFRDLGIDQALFREKFYFGTPGFEDNGELIPLPQGRVLYFRSNRRGEVVVNMSRVINIDATDRDQLSYAEIWTQKQVLAITDFLKSYVPGFEKCYLVESSWLVGIRESARMVGRQVLTASDVILCRRFPDTVACGYYIIDIHDPSGRQKAIGGKIHGEYFSIPYGSLVSENIKNLAGAGRIISADHVAHSATRIQGACVSTGQAAGSAAALCAKDDIDYPALDTKILRESLLAQGMFLGK